ncbi:ribonuclease P protein component [Algicella marina]|uniref:Ribonuclease P protein component n=1 Tax=Algicella marina TaxID=2683284 RepID=A0A6P1T3D9_9RHOB|nr:ribonuclease P protein component [Algicella marina]QHQ35819.1 ribonuclease P protein component [Algicella marina]
MAQSGPPDAPEQGRSGGLDAFVASVGTLTARRDFLAAARARKQSAPGLILQARQRGADEIALTEVRIGYTCSKKVGNAVARNRAKRRLRAAAHEVLKTGGRRGWDYVLIGRRDVTASRPFPDLCADLARALARIHGDGE